MNHRAQNSLIAHTTLFGAIIAFTLFQTAMLYLPTLLGLPTPGWLNTALTISTQVIFLVGPAIFYFLSPADRPALRLKPKKGILWAFPFALLAIPCMLALGNLGALFFDWLGAGPIPDVLGEPGTLPQSIIMALWVGITPAFGEEFMFRGLILPNYSHLSRGKMIWLAGMLFGLMHGIPASLPLHVLLGAVLCLLCFTTDCLWTASLFHFLYNAAQVMLSYALGKPENEAVTALLFGSTNADLLIRSLAIFVVTGAALLLLCLHLWRRDKRENPEKYAYDPAQRKEVRFSSTWPLLPIYGYYALNYGMVLLIMFSEPLTNLLEQFLTR